MSTFCETLRILQSRESDPPRPWPTTQRDVERLLKVLGMATYMEYVYCVHPYDAPFLQRYDNYELILLVVVLSQYSCESEPPPLLFCTVRAHNIVSLKGYPVLSTINKLIIIINIV